MTTDLPVYQKDGTYDASLLCNLIESATSPKSWESAGGPSTIAPYPQNLSLVISTTGKNHDAIQTLLNKFRK